jgi:hypothetical protein
MQHYATFEPVQDTSSQVYGPRYLLEPASRRSPGTVWPVEGVESEPFRCFRVLQTGSNSGADCNAIKPTARAAMFGTVVAAGASGGAVPVIAAAKVIHGDDEDNVSGSCMIAGAGGLAILSAAVAAGGLAISAVAIAGSGATSVAALSVDAVRQRDVLACGGIELYGKLTLFQGT